MTSLRFGPLRGNELKFYPVGAGTCLLFLLIFFAAGPFSLAAQSNVPSESPEGLTSSLVSLNVQHGKAPASTKASVLAKLQKVAAARNQLLASLIDENPEAVLKVALPAAHRRSLPASVQSYVEEEVELDGDIEILHEDRSKGSPYHYRLKTSAHEFSLYFVKDPPTHLTTGTKVRVHGVRVNEALALQSGSGGVQALSSVLPNTFGEQRTLVILVNFQNNPTQPYTTDYARNVILTTTSNFFLENSYQQTFLTGDVRGWVYHRDE